MRGPQLRPEHAEPRLQNPTGLDPFARTPYRIEPLSGRGDGRQVAAPEHPVIARGRSAAQPCVRRIGPVVQAGQIVEEVPGVQECGKVDRRRVRRGAPCPNPVEVESGLLSDNETDAPGFGFGL